MEILYNFFRKIRGKKKIHDCDKLHGDPLEPTVPVEVENSDVFDEAREKELPQEVEQAEEVNENSVFVPDVQEDNKYGINATSVPETDNQSKPPSLPKKPGLFEDVYLDFNQRFLARINRLLRLLKNRDSEASCSNFSNDYLVHLASSDLKDLGIAVEDFYHQTLSQNHELDKFLLDIMMQRRKTVQFKSMMKCRQSLPAYKEQKEILNLIKKNQVLVLMGETGCGKTTQVPQYILDSYIDSGKGSLCKIICTQPRRISAIGVAERVAEERDIPCGEGGDVGYHIRLECKKPRDRGSILYCTIGIMLIQLQSNPYLSGISHLIVDEVHERDMLSDFFLMNLQNVLDKNKELKVILMSATVNAQQFSAYFGDCPMVTIPGRTFGVTSFTLEDMIEKTKYRPASNIRIRKWVKVLQDPNYNAQKKKYLESIHNKYSKQTIQTLSQYNEDELDLQLIVEMLVYVCQESEVGTILVFLPGWQDIETLLSKLISAGFKKSHFLIIPLHSNTAKKYQKQVLNKAPNGKRKIILSTNIAETSITINDCTIVIDCGKFKLKSFDPVNNTHLLKPQWVAVSNVKQRRGRAGRTQAGVCYHMFTKLRESMLDPYQVPEMQRSSLEELILNIKILKLEKCSVVTYFMNAMSPPKQEAVEASLSILKELNAITSDEKLTPLGFLLARLPVNVHIGKMLLLGAIFSCLDPILSIAASLSFKDPFMVPLDKHAKIDAKEAKVYLSDGCNSDLMLFVYALKEFYDYKLAGGNYDYDECYEFCNKYFLSHDILKMLVELKFQYARYLKQLCFLNDGYPFHPHYNFNSENYYLISAIICASLYPNVAKITRGNQNRGPCAAQTKDGDHVFVHPKSINAFELNDGVEWLAYNTKMKSSQIYIHDTTCVNIRTLLLFGNQVKYLSGSYGRYLLVDDWLCFNDSNYALNHALFLKKQLDEVLAEKYARPSITDWSLNSKEGQVLRCVVDVISWQE